MDTFPLIDKYFCKFSALRFKGSAIRINDQYFLHSDNFIQK
jgi:hypothetical protein